MTPPLRFHILSHEMGIAVGTISQTCVGVVSEFPGKRSCAVAALICNAIRLVTYPQRDRKPLLGRGLMVSPQRGRS